MNDKDLGINVNGITSTIGVSELTGAYLVVAHRLKAKSGKASKNREAPCHQR